MIKKKFFKTNDNCEVTFELADVDADTVSVVCEHNEWSPVEMKKLKSGVFRTRIKLEKDSRYQFRYLIEGRTWTNDNDADDVAVSPFGTANSVVDTSDSANA